jgi:DNA-directed RNA polymerase subunit F
MAEPTMEEGRLVSLAEVKMMLTKAQLEREELTYEQKLALEHSLRFARLSVDDSEALIEDLKKAIPDMTDLYAFKVADLCPTEPDDVKSVFAKSRITVGDAEVRKIIDLVLKYHTPDED